MEKTESNIVDKIISNIPANMNPAEYIMRKLNISKGSAYRRLNGTIPFSYDEIAVLAKEMNLSIDEVIFADSRKKFIIEFEDYFNNDVHNIIYKSLEDYLNLLHMNQKMNKVTTTEALNNLLLVYTIFNDNLFRFYYYKYLQQYDIQFSKTKMQDMVIPDFIIEIKNKLIDLILNTHNCTNVSILDPHIFYNAMSEIQYYHKRNFIDDLNLKLVVKDIKDLLTNIEKRTSIEDIDGGRRYLYFISQRNIYSNSCLIETDHQVYSAFYPQNAHPVICYDKRLCELHNRYLQANKRQSILISNSNEELQISFFQKQNEELEKLLEDI